MTPIKSSEITPEHLYLSRRKFMAGIGALATSAALLGACGPQESGAAAPNPVEEGPAPQAKAQADELGDPLTPFETVTNYNNYYEFTTDKEGVAPLAQGFKTSPWQVEVGGLVNNPKTYDLDQLQTKFPQEERVYRLRCVEAWSMVIPWMGFSLA